VWDEIKSTSFEGQILAPAVVKSLLAASRERQTSLGEFLYLKKTIDWFKERQEQKSISLNLAQREAGKLADDDYKKKIEAERDVLAKANFATRVVKLDSVLTAEATVPKAVAATATLADGDTDAPDAEAQSKLDIHLRETLRVVIDGLHLKQDQQLSATSQPPSTASPTLPKS
jgi:carboxyl-terminal processing protease